MAKKSAIGGGCFPSVRKGEVYKDSIPKDYPVEMY
jgi:hypothetical protein